MGSTGSRRRPTGAETEEVLRVPMGDEVSQLHSPKNAEALKRFIIANSTLSLNAIEPSLAKAPIHSILTSGIKRAERNKLLETLLTYGDVDVNLKDLDRDTPLHVAIKNNDIPSIKMLVAFGADVNIKGGDGLTPTELCKLKSLMANSDAQPSTEPQNQATPEPSSDGQPQEEDERVKEGKFDMTQFMRSVGGIVRNEQPRSVDVTLHGQSLPQSDPYSAMPYDENANARKLYNELYDALRKRARSMSSLDPDSMHLAVVEKMQRVEFARFRQTGSRILCLDGGGMKGLIELDVMESIEQQTGKSITELFDWIVGTSTGGILALGLVYAKKSVQELRQLFFRMKDEVFANPKFGVAYDSEALEKMLKDVIGSTEMRMSDIKHPKVLVAATYKGSNRPKLHLFNNCFDDEHNKEVVWKVARSTCAGPILFPEFNNYVDGGVLCNNPTEKGVTAIQNYHLQKGEKLPISLIVSIGCGIYCEGDLGSVDYLNNLSLSRMRNLVELFTSALGQTELVAEACEHNFREQDIPYYRFSPHIDELSISAGETDSEKLIDMTVKARQQTVFKVTEMVAKHLPRSK